MVLMHFFRTHEPLQHTFTRIYTHPQPFLEHDLSISWYVSSDSVMSDSSPPSRSCDSP